MRRFAFGSLFLALSVSAYAGDSKTVNAACETAMTKAMALAAHRKWWPDRPDPKANVLNIRTHANFVKNTLPSVTVPVIGPLVGLSLSHEKVGELLFQEQGGSCLVTSNGHPADVVLSDLEKAFAGTSAPSPSLPPKPESTALTNESHQQSPPSVATGGGVLGVAGVNWEQGDLSGIEVTQVSRDSSAELAGLHRGDVITDVNGKRLRSTQDLANLLAQLGPGSRISIGYLIKTQLAWLPKQATVILAKR